MTLKPGSRYALKLRYMPYSLDVVYRGGEEHFGRDYHTFGFKEGFAFVLATDEDIEELTPTAGKHLAESERFSA